MSEAKFEEVDESLTRRKMQDAVNDRLNVPLRDDSIDSSHAGTLIHLSDAQFADKRDCGGTGLGKMKQ